MKKTLSFVSLLMAAAMILPSCDISFSNRRDPETIDLKFKSAEIIEADQQFAFELFNQVCSLNNSENIMISPISVSYALGMTYNGAAGTTQEAFENVLHFTGLTKQEVNDSYKDLVGQIIGLDPKVELSMANSIWYREGANVLETFKTVNQTYFDAAVEELDFSDPGAVDIINNWIEDKTNDKIQDMLDEIPAGAYMYLINAIYFNATWLYEFDKADTYTGSFQMEDNTTMDADFMVVEGSFYRTANMYYSAVELPYGDSAFSMVAILPSENTDLSSFISEYSVQDWNQRAVYSAPVKVKIELPKFSYGFKDLLNDPLINLGLGNAFSDAADFSNITLETDLFISRVIHQSFIDVNEKGTEAAAATIVEMKENAVQTETVSFNRPFMYIIKENSTGAILFMGKVGKPGTE